MQQFQNFLTLSQLYQSEVLQSSNQKQNNSGYKFKFDPNYTDRKSTIQPQVDEPYQAMKYSNNKIEKDKECKIVNYSENKKSTLIEDYKLEIEHQFNQNSSQNQSKIFTSNDNQISFSSNHYHFSNQKCKENIPYRNQIYNPIQNTLRLSQQIKNFNVDIKKESEFKISLYFYSPNIGITYSLKEEIIIVIIQQSQIQKITQTIADFQIENLLVYYSVNFPLQLLNNIHTILKHSIQNIEMKQIEQYNIQEKLSLLGFIDSSIYDENVIDKDIYINLCSALPIIQKSNLEIILNLISQNEKQTILKLSENLQTSLGILKQDNQKLSIQSLFEKYFTTTYAKKQFIHNLKFPITSYQIISKRLNYLSIFQQMALQPSNQKLMKTPQKIGSFEQTLKLLSSYQSKSEPYAKLFLQLNNLIDFVQQIKQMVSIDRRLQQKTCQIFKDIALINILQIEKLVDFIESSLFFNQQQIQIKESKYPQLEQYLQQEIILKSKKELIINKHQTELALQGIKVQNIDLIYNYEYQLSITVNKETIQKIISMEWELTKECCEKGLYFFKTPYTLDLDDQFGNLEQEITKLKEIIIIQIVKEIQQYSELLLQIEKTIGEVDYYFGLIVAMTQHRLCIPKLNNNNKINIIGGRHLLVEQTVKQGIQFQPNDFSLGDKRIFLIVGPNYSGKSVFIRQIGLIIYLAQCGFPVPAVSADIQLIEEIFTVFPCEGKQNNNLSIINQELINLNNALHINNRALILMDEVGKNFKYQIGSNLHRSALEFFGSQTQNTLIVLSATHYSNHEELLINNIFQQGEMEVIIESNKSLVFVYRINFGKKRNHQGSYGLEVALMIHQNEDLYQRGQQLYDLLTKYKYLQE